MNIGIHRRKLRGAAIVLASFMVAWLILGQITGFAAQPKIMVSDYKVSEEYIEAGGSFNLSITIKNTADKKVSNLKISVASENGDIIPSSGAGTDYLAELAGGEEHTFTFPIKAGKNIEEQSYKINVVNEYDDRYGTAWTVTDSIYVPVKLAQRASITDLYSEDSVTLGDSVEITGQVNNLGTGTLYNVTAEVAGDYVKGITSFVGNIEPGKSGYLDLLTTATKTTPNSQKAVTELILTYEDKEGNVTTDTERFTIEVESPEYTNVEKVKDDVKTVNTTAVAWIVIGVIVVVLIIIFAVRRSRRKKEILEEF